MHLQTRILVTHGVHWLTMVDTIIVMEAGRIQEMGSYEELLNHRGAFSFFLQSTLLHGQDDKSDEDEDEESMGEISL